MAPGFNPETFERGAKFALELDVGRAGVRLPVFVVRGARPGTRLVVTGGIHGDEFEGVRAVFDVYRALDPIQMAGDLLAVPVSNPPAFFAGRRESPLDGANLARVFPGDPAGTPTQVIAHLLAHSIIRRADLFLDLHSAGVQWLMPALVGYDAADPRSRDAALSFGASILWGHHRIAAGRTISYAATCGIPWLYTEARGGGRMHPSDLALFVNGILNLLRRLEVLPGKPEPVPVELHLSGDGDLDRGAAAASRGFFVPAVELLDTIRQGDEVGRLLNLAGDTVEVFHAPRDGVVAMIRAFPVVGPGDPVFLLAEAAGRSG